MFKRTVGMGVIYACVLYLYTAYTDLKCQYTLKSAECEFYKAICEAYETGTDDEKGKKFRNKIALARDGK